MPPSSSELITAISHPTRRLILRALVEAPFGSASADELAEAIERPVAQVGYHLKTLARCEVLRSSPGGEGGNAQAGRYGWALDLEPDWVRVVLDIWVESRAAG